MSKKRSTRARKVYASEHVRPFSRLSQSRSPKKPLALKSLADAKRYSDAVVILEGDSGGQIYAVIPIQEVHCSEETLYALLEDIDKLAWCCPVSDDRCLYYERPAEGDHIPGGMGGAKVIKGIWIHQELVEKGLNQSIVEVLQGKTSRIVPHANS